MAHIVTLSPSGRQIDVESGETILAAARREQLPLSFNCERGSCGDCRARILEGRLAQHLHHDYVFRGKDQQYPMLLACRAIPASDMMIELLEVTAPTDIPVQTVETQVTRIEHLAGDVVVINLRTPRSKPLQFLAGQYVSLSLGSLPARDIYVASCPCNGRDLQFHVRHHPGDEFSEYAFSKLKSRDRVLLEGPKGGLVLSENHDRPMVFIAIDEGFAPIKSLVEHAMSLELSQPMLLLWLTKYQEGHYLANQCRAWQDALDGFSYQLIDLSAGVGSIPKLVSDWLQADIYISGPEAIQTQLKMELLNTGASSIITE